MARSAVAGDVGQTDEGGSTRFGIPTGLRPYCGSSGQADRLAAVLRGVADLDEGWLQEAAYDEVERALRAIPGVGAFTASAILLRVLGRPDRAPLEMPQLASVVAAVYGPGVPVEVVRERYGAQVGLWGYLTKTALSWLGVPTGPATGRS